MIYVGLNEHKKEKKNNQDKQKLYTVKSSLFVGEGGVRCFVSNPCPQIFILMNNTNIGLKFIKIIPNFLPTILYPHEQGNIWQ